MTTDNNQTETIDRLFLELSQFTKATTGKELALQAENERIKKLGDAQVTIDNTLAESVEKLQAENERLRKDADRLEWLFSNPLDALDIIGRHRSSESRFIRTTIDAARAKEGS